MKTFNVYTSDKESNHLGAVDIVRLIKPDEVEGKVATMNHAWLEIGKSLEPHRHKDGCEYYLFLKGVGEMTIGNENFVVDPGDFIKVSKGLMHSLTNNNDASLEFVTLRTIE